MMTIEEFIDEARTTVATAWKAIATAETELASDSLEDASAALDALCLELIDAKARVQHLAKQALFKRLTAEMAGTE